jgi:fructosamine-3-kinase
MTAIAAAAAPGGGGGGVGGGAARRRGAELAALHACTDPRGRGYGFDGENHIGTTPQPNSWCADWVEFNAVHRLGHQLRLARDGGSLLAGEAQSFERVIDRLDSLLPRHPRPGLLHGDLWSGNALPTSGGAAGGRVALIDPACSFGDGWADIAMMRLFGGFPPACFEAYAAANPDRDGLEERLAVYQLYHLLNHVNIFGRGYAAQALALAARLA